MKIVHVCTSRDQLRRGAEQFCLTLSSSLVNSGHQVTLITGNLNKTDFSHLPFTFFSIPEAANLFVRKFAFDYCNPYAVRSFNTIIEKIKPDIIHFHSFYGLSTALAKFSARHYPVIVTLHDSWLAFADSGIVRPHLGLANSYLKVPHGYVHRQVNKYLLKDAILVSPSHWMKDFFETAGFQTPLQIQNGIEVDIGQPETTYQNIFLWVGTLDTFKGLPLIIDTLSDIINRMGWRFIVVGDGPQKRRLESEYPEIDFVGYCDPQPYYKQASILIVSSIGYENFPTVVLEGMQHGLCIVGHQLGGIEELIDHNQTGILYKSVDSLATVLPLLAETPERIRKLGKSARDEFDRNYRWDLCLERYLALYREVISQR